MFRLTADVKEQILLNKNLRNPAFLFYHLGGVFGPFFSTAALRSLYRVARGQGRCLLQQLKQLTINEGPWKRWATPRAARCCAKLPGRAWKIGR